jgi:hypothetical protein
LAQHALSPANTLDAVSIAMATRAVVVILIMVNAEMAGLWKVFKFFALYAHRLEGGRFACRVSNQSGCPTTHFG